MTATRPETGCNGNWHHSTFFRGPRQGITTVLLSSIRVSHGAEPRGIEAIAVQVREIGARSEVNACTRRKRKRTKTSYDLDTVQSVSEPPPKKKKTVKREKWNSFEKKIIKTLRPATIVIPKFLRRRPAQTQTGLPARWRTRRRRPRTRTTIGIPHRSGPRAVGGPAEWPPRRIVFVRQGQRGSRLLEVTIATTTCTSLHGASFYVGIHIRGNI